MPYQSTKTFGHELGLSVCFRQWRADSHCRLLHGYALGFKLTFEASELDRRNWVMDFGGLKQVKNGLQDMFDHTLVVAADDPELPLLMMLDQKGVADVRQVPHTGCEAFAELAYKWVLNWMTANGHYPRVKLVSVEVKEHGANSAIYLG